MGAIIQAGEANECPRAAVPADAPGFTRTHGQRTVAASERAHRDPAMTEASSILAPAAVLVLWSLAMLFWMAAVRIPALGNAGVDLGTRVGGRGQDLEGLLPASVNWKAHNYAHLMEQPTLFYAVVAILALAGAGEGLNAQLAWAYTGLRVVHSLVQATWNRVAVRFALFILSTLVLCWLAVNALLATL